MKNKKLPHLVVLFILTLITVLFWIGFNIYQAFSKQNPVIVPEEMLIQINPKLDTKVIEQMKGKLYESK